MSVDDVPESEQTMELDTTSDSRDEFKVIPGPFEWPTYKVVKEYVRRVCLSKAKDKYISIIILMFKMEVSKDYSSPKKVPPENKQKKKSNESSECAQSVEKFSFYSTLCFKNYFT